MMLLNRRTVLLSGLLLCFGNGLAAQEPSQPDLVFLLIGQSNMAGRAPLEEGDDTPFPGALLLTDQNAWEPARNPLNRYASNRKDLSMQRISPGDGFLRRIHEALPDKTVGVISNARGGTSIEEWAADQPLYVNTLKRLRAVPNLKLAGVLWHQGEANAEDPAYLDKLVELVQRLRKDLNQPDLPFIAGEVYGERPVNQKIAQLPMKLQNTAFVTADGLKVFDKVHFDRESQRMLGARYANAWLNLTNPKTEGEP